MRHRRTLEVLGWGFILIFVGIGLLGSLARYVMSAEAHAEAMKPLYGEVYAEEQIPRFHANPAATAAHVIPGALFMITGPLQFVKRLRARRPALHRWSGRVFLLSSLVLAAGALLILWRFPFEGFAETIPVLLFLGVFVVALSRAFVHALRRNFTAHREWMIRGFAVGLGVSTIRVVFDLFKYTLEVRDRENFTTSLWVGWVLMSVVAEMWIRATRTKRAVAIAAPGLRVASPGRAPDRGVA